MDLDTAVQKSPAATPRVARPPALLALLGVVVCVAAFLRLGGLTAESLWWDEVLTTYSAREPLTRVIDAVRGHENAPPFYFIVMNLWVKGFGMSDLSLRLPSALMGIATVALLWRVGAELFNATVGLTAAALLAVSPIHIAYSQEARMYALLVLLLTANLWAVVRVMRTGSARWQVAYVLTAALALLTHTFAAFTLLAVNLFWLVRLIRRGETGVTWRRWLTLNAAVIVLFGPWVPATIEVAQMGLPWLTTSTTFLDGIVGYAGIAAILFVAFSALAIIWAIRGRDDRVLLLVLLALVPILGPIAYGPFTTRYGIASLIGLTTLAAFGASRIGRWACVMLVVFAAAGWAMTSTLGHPRYLNHTPKADVRGAVAHVRAHAAEGDVIVAGTRGIWHVAEHYVKGTELPLIKELDTIDRQRPQRVWLVAEAGSELPLNGYQVKSRRALGRVEVLELQRSIEPATTTGVPSTYPRN